MPTDPDPDPAPAPDVVTAVAADLAVDPRAVHTERIAGRAARLAELAAPLAPEIAALVPAGGLWSHQTEAIDHLRARRSVAVATGTASGKSLCYQLPIAEVVAAERPGTALLLHPTKALAQDQHRALWALGAPGLVPATYDGDVDFEDRAWVRTGANVVLTNPEMLHHGILPDHARWATFLLRLRYVVVDELHTMRGVFGSHVAHLLRRLRRLCALHGADPTFCFTSATIGAPGRLASELSGLDVVEVTDDGSPQGPRHVVLWDRAARDDGMRTSTSAATAQLVAELVRHDVRTIAFCRSRRLVEVVAEEVRRRLPGDRRDRVRSYRAGYLATERRAIEDELAAGALDAVIATSALELGIDIGSLDGCVLHGFPGTVASMWQQIGRAGRQQRPSLAVVVAGDDQLDQWFLAHPDELFARPAERAVINLANPQICDPHLACAAYEHPLRPSDERWWPGLLDEGIARLVAEDRLVVRPRDGEPRAHWSRRGRPGDGLGLRSGSRREVRIVTDDGDLVGTIDEARATAQVHPGASYLHQGQPYRVESLDLDGCRAVVADDDGSEFTQAMRSVDLTVVVEDERRKVGGVHLALGSVDVTTTVTGYRRFDAGTRQLLGIEPLELPASRLVTRAFWYAVPDDVLVAAGLAPMATPLEELGGSLHAAEHAMIGLLPLFTICDRWDVGGLSTPLLDHTASAAIVVYDAYPGGAGIAELGYEAGVDHLRATAELIAACDCATGCPSCVQSPKCGNGNEPLSKAGSLRLLETILAAT